MRKYNRRTWLNKEESSSTSSIITFDGEVPYGDKNLRDTFLKIYDCKNSITIHKKDDESVEIFLDKLKLLNKEIESFIKHLTTIK